MTDNTRQISEEFLTCTICYEIYKSPKSLPCLHSYCEQCLSHHIQSSSRNKVAKGFHCPICRQFVEIPRPTENISQWASQMKDNFHLSGMIEALKIKDPANARTLRPMCSQHGNKLDLVCVDCDTIPVCSTCVAVSHRMCPQVYTVETAAQERRTCMMVLIQPVEERIERSKSKQIELDKEFQLVEAHREEAAKELTARYNDAIEAIKDEYSRLMEKLVDEHKKCEKVFQVEKTSLKIYQDQLEKCQKKAEKLMSESDMSVVNKYRGIKEEIDEMRAGKQDTLAPRVPVFTITFEATPDFSSKVHDIKLGDICVTKRKRELQILDSIRPNQASLSSSIGHPSSPVLPVSPLAKTSTNVKFELKVSAKMKGDKTACCLRDVTVVNGNVIVVTDGGNSAVKSFYTQGHRLETSRYNTDRRTPHGITCLAGNTVAVMVPRQKEMLLLKVSPNIFLQKKVSTHKSYYAVSAVSPEYLAVTTSPSYGFPSIDIIDVEGKVYRVVRDDTTVGNLLSNPMHMCTTPLGDIVITDPTLPSLICIRQNGYKIFEYEPTTDYKMKTPKGVAVDKHGAILVADEDSNSIVLLSSDGLPIRRLLAKSDKLESSPKGVALGERGMLVTIHATKILVFKID